MCTDSAGSRLTAPPRPAGSELNLAVEAAKEIEGSGKTARVVSMVCWELFEEQDDSYKKSVLPPDVTARVRRAHACVCPLMHCVGACHAYSCSGSGLSAAPSMLQGVLLATLLAPPVGTGRNT